MIEDLWATLPICRKDLDERSGNPQYAPVPSTTGRVDPIKNQEEPLKLAWEDQCFKRAAICPRGDGFKRDCRKSPKVNYWVGGRKK